MTKAELDEIRERLDDYAAYHARSIHDGRCLDDARALLAEVERLRPRLSATEERWWAIQDALYRVAYRGADPVAECSQHCEPEVHEHDFKY